MRRPTFGGIAIKVYVFDKEGYQIMTQRFMSAELCYQSVRRTLKAFYAMSEVSKKMKQFKEGERNCVW